MAAPAPAHDRSTTQKYLDIQDITNDMVILRDGSVSLILQVNAINFGLLSEPEQDAIIYAYAALINSLSFPIQITIKSQPKDVSRYLEYIDAQQQQASNELRRRQITQYRQFVANLITEQNVLDKTFYVVLPLSAVEMGLASTLNPLSPVTDQNKDITFDKYYVIEKAKNVLIPRRDHMMSQFGRLGLIARQLGTKELIHLFYVAYNAEAAEGARVVDTQEYTSALIQTPGEIPASVNPPAIPSPASTTAPAPVPAPATTPVLASPVASPVSANQAAVYETVNEGENIRLENVSAIPQESFATGQAQQPR